MGLFCLVEFVPDYSRVPSILSDAGSQKASFGLVLIFYSTGKQRIILVQN